MAKYFYIVNGIPVQLGDDLTDEEAKKQAREKQESGPSVTVSLWEQTQDRGAVNVSFR